MGPPVCARSPIVFLGGLLLLLSWAPTATGIAPYSPQDDLEESFTFPSSTAAELPTNIKLIDYNIEITPDYKTPIESTSDFTGKVVFNFEVTSAVSTIKLLASSLLSISTTTIKQEETDVSIKSTSHKSEALTITTRSNLAVSTVYTATIEFSGKIQDTTHGIYKSTYEKDNGQKGVLFTTHFQPVHAREAFPCFDEPNFKTTFILSIDVPPGYSALSNTPISDTSLPTTKDGSSLTRITFEKTVPMSSYLVAFIVYETSSFTYSHTVISESDTSIRTWARKDAVDGRLTDFSQDISFKILRELEDYTAEPYKRENMIKIDQVAVPDFGAGAMENWGLVIYRQTRLFYDEEKDSENDRKRVAAIIAHELTHQWFGNLVTTQWWDTTWLNEGFARYFQYLILSRIYPSWRMMDQLLLDQQMAIFVSDSVSSAKPLNHDVTTAEDINGQFGSITYSKGACIVRMMSYILGEDKFKEGLQKYVQRGTVSVTPKDLFEDLSKYVPDDRRDIPFETAMETWTTQAGFPVILVERDYDTYSASISQYRFFSDETKEEDPTLYHVPIIWSSSADSEERFLWLANQSTTLNDLPEIEHWLLVQANGYYRVNYDEGNWLTLTWTLANKDRSRISPADRAKLIDDALVLARYRHLPYRILGYMLRYLRQETDVLPWAAADRGLRFFHIQLGNVDKEGIFNAYVRQATTAIYNALYGFAHRGDAPELILRGTVLNWACLAGNEQCLEEARLRLRQFLYQNTPLDPNLKEMILCHGTSVGTRMMWDDLWVLYKNSQDATEREIFLEALACTENKEDLYTYLQRVSLGLNGANTADTNSAFQAAVSRPTGIPRVLDFIIENFQQMHSTLSRDTIENILSDVSDQLSSEEQYLKLSGFVEKQILSFLLDETFGDKIVAKVKSNMEYIKSIQDDALKAFSDATPKEDVTEKPFEPTEAPGGSSRPELQQFVTFLLLTLVLKYFAQ